MGKRGIGKDREEDKGTLCFKKIHDSFAKLPKVGSFSILQWGKQTYYRPANL